MAERDRKGRKQTKKSYERRLSSVTASAAALYALPSVVSAAIVHVSGAPVSLSATGPAGAGAFDLSVGWNVDGDANVDFELRKTGTVVTDGPTLRDASGYMFLNSAGLNGNGVVQVFGTADTRAIRRLLPGEVVGPTLGGSYQFGSPGQTNRLMLSFNSSTNGAYMQHGVNVAGQALNGGFVADQLQYFGFSFTSGADTFYGWAAILHDTLGVDRRLEIVEWAYNNTANASIEVAAVPIPAHGLAMLAAGAGSVLTMRRKRREAAEAAKRDGDANP